jgi:hypothetical protein
MTTIAVDELKTTAAASKFQAARTINELRARAAILSNEARLFAASEVAAIGEFQACLELADRIEAEQDEAQLEATSKELEAKMAVAAASFATLKTNATALVAACGVGEPRAEWEECRRTIDRFDKLLVDIRKTAFGVITALFSALAFLFSLSPATTSVMPSTKAAVFAVICLLIVSAYGVDRVHQIWLEVAVARAKFLEERLGFALSNEIGQRFSARLAGLIWVGLYSLLLVMGWIIFFISISPGWHSGQQLFTLVLLVLSVTAIVYFTFFDYLTGRYRASQLWRAMVWLVPILVVVVAALWELHRRKII